MKILNNKFLISTFILLTLMPSCLYKKKIALSNIIIPEIKWNYNVGIDGVECKICALKLYKKLEKLENISEVKIICTSDFKECHANFNFKDINNNIDINRIKKTIEDEGFELEYISGNLIGFFDDKLDKFILVGPDKINQGIKFINYKNNDLLIAPKIKTIISGKLIFKRKLIKDIKTNQNDEIWMTLN